MVIDKTRGPKSRFKSDGTLLIDQTKTVTCNIRTNERDIALVYDNSDTRPERPGEAREHEPGEGVYMYGIIATREEEKNAKPVLVRGARQQIFAFPRTRTYLTDVNGTPYKFLDFRVRKYVDGQLIFSALSEHDTLAMLSDAPLRWRDCGIDKPLSKAR
jgi:hypothetical protein